MVTLRIKILLLFAVLSITLFRAQKKDSLEKEIQEVVITGQYTPQSIRKSLYKVEVITRDDIQKMAVNNVAEVLNQSLNILIIPEKKNGDSKANIMGLGANYTKVLIDNIPVVGDTGLGSNIDLTKLSLDQIERIEIVNGSMGVEFGNNAIAGVINVITKKSSKKKWAIRGFVQEETVGKEYDWIDYGKGRHIQSLNISHNVSERWFANISYNRNDFQGFWGQLGGKNYFLQDGKRGYEWQPKEQNNPSFLLRYSSPKTKLFYKADYLSEHITYYNPIVESKNLGGGERTFTAIDRDYFTRRMLHHLNLETLLFDRFTFNADVSYQKQTRENQDYVFDIPARKTLSTQDRNTYYEAETWYSRGTLSHILKKEQINLQLGYEGDITQGFAGWSTASFGGNNVMKKVMSIGVFGSAEIGLTDRWFLRPGFRVNFSDTFRTVPNFSLILKNKTTENSEFRAIVGSSNRNPTFEELFTYFVDSNHDIRGNESLKPENSFSGTLFYSVFSNPTAIYKWNIDFSTMYLMVRDRIDITTINQSPLQFKYLNIDSFQSWGNTVSGKISGKNFGFNAGVSVLGRAQRLESNPSEKYLYSTEFNASTYYTLPKWKTSFAIYYKGIGKSYRLAEDKSLGITQQVLQQQKGFSLLDASVSQKIWGEHLDFTFGVRNLFNITQVPTINQSSGAHGNSSPAQLLFYGRSYFGKIQFNF